MMIKFEVTEEARREALGHVFYEAEQLSAMAVLSSEAEAHRRAFLESRLLHARILLEFFQKSSRSSVMDGSARRELDDVLSRDYKFGPFPDIVPKDVFDRLNKDLAHLTYSRNERSESDRVWTNALVVSPVLRKVAEFIEHLLLSGQCEGSPRSREEWQALKRRVSERAKDSAVSGST